MAASSISRLVRTLISLLIFAIALPGAESVDEYQVKALFIYNFAKFVEWPSEAFPGLHDVITVCIAGQDPFGSEIDQAVKGKKINSRDLVVKRIAKVDDLKGCQVLFIGALEKKRIKTLLSAAESGSILSVGDSDGFTDLGGVISFATDGNKVRFDINLEAAERTRLKISSKLLSLARSVKEPAKQ